MSLRRALLRKMLDVPYSVVVLPSYDEMLVAAAEGSGQGRAAFNNARVFCDKELYPSFW